MQTRRRDRQRLFLGVDGGGTRCRARLVDECGLVLGEGSAGPANTLLGAARAVGEARLAAEQALAQAGLGSDSLARVHVGAGLAGANLASERERVLATAHPFASWSVDTDAYAACLGAHGGGDGAILILGTGSCGCAIVDGRALSVGGWGPRVSDHGSAATLGQAALRRALLAHEGVIEGSGLCRALMAHFADSPERLVQWAEEATPGDYGAFAPQVAQAARAGDPQGEVLMRESAAGAALLVEALRARGAPAVALVGGLADALRPWLPDRAAALVCEARGDAMDGAIMLARAGAGA